MSFASLGLRTDLLRAVATQRYAQPTPIQKQAIPVILAGHDVLAGAQTGTGKTAAFVLPLLQLLADKGHPQRQPRALILAPTRELAAQIGERVHAYGIHLSLRSTVIFGGVGIQPQVNQLRRGVDVLIATPGRLLDHASQRTVDLSRIELLVLDEADRMLDMGFIHDVRRILALLPPRRQNLLFSATYSEEMRQFSDSVLHQPQLIEVARRNTAAETVIQTAYPVDKARKRELLTYLFQREDWQQVLVFTRTKAGANRLAEHLAQAGIAAAAIHGNKSQAARTRALDEFKRGVVRALVATDIAARGLDIAQLPQVVNFELPNVAEDYVHRIGRTGRAGAGGLALSLVSHDEMVLLKSIQRLLGRQFALKPVVGFEPTLTPPSIELETSERRRPQVAKANPGRGHHAPPRAATPPVRSGGARRGGGQRSRPPSKPN